MPDSKVYYMDAHSESPETSLAAKMITVFDNAGLDQLTIYPFVLNILQIG